MSSYNSHALLKERGLTQVLWKMVLLFKLNGEKKEGEEGGVGEQRGPRVPRTPAGVGGGKGDSPRPRPRRRGRRHKRKRELGVRTGPFRI